MVTMWMVSAALAQTREPTLTTGGSPPSREQQQLDQHNREVDDYYYRFEYDPDARADLPPRASMLRPEAVARAVLFAAQQPPSVQISSIAVQATG